MVSLSIALVTRNRPDSLFETLKSLRQQSIQPTEVIVSDDSSLDRAHETKDIADRWDCHYIQGPRQGLYANRNHVALACQGSHIRTMDDDHRFPVGHFERCLEAVQSDPHSIWTTGEIGFLNGRLSWHCPTANQLVSSGVGGGIMDLDNNWSIADGSTIYPRAVFERGYRMVEWFNHGSSYLEFGAYLYCRGFRSRCVTGALIEHYPSEDSIMNMSKEMEALRSTLFASLCYNLYFKPNYALAVRNILTKSLRTSQKSEFLMNITTLVEYAKARWADN
jgi:glycosyltransferase involved in cell wall biosynthesis